MRKVKSSLKLNSLPVYLMGFGLPVLMTITLGNSLIWYFPTNTLSEDLTIPKLSFFSKATLRPLYSMGTPFLSVKRRTLGTDGLSAVKVLMFAFVISMTLEWRYLAAAFCRLYTVNYD